MLTSTAPISREDLRISYNRQEHPIGVETTEFDPIKLPKVAETSETSEPVGELMPVSTTDTEAIAEGLTEALGTVTGATIATEASEQESGTTQFLVAVGTKALKHLLYHPQSLCPLLAHPSYLSPLLTLENRAKVIDTSERVWMVRPKHLPSAF